MNLAFVGFLIAGIVFALYAATFYTIAGKKLPVFLQNYAIAYFSLALAFVIYAFASLTTDFLATSVMIGDALLLLGSVSLLSVLFHKNDTLKVASMVIGVIFSLLFLWWRMSYYPPVPFIENGVLVFNTQKIVAIILDVLFIAIWLPANLVVARAVTAKTHLESLTYAYSFIYVVTTIAAILFISFKTVPMVLLSFTTLVICFVMLLYSNYVINKLLPDKK